MIIRIVSILVAFLVVSCLAQAAPLRVAFVGSSTTVGVGTTRPDRRFSTLVCNALGWQEINQGLSGSTLMPFEPSPGYPPVLSAVERVRELLTPKPDLVIFMYGANDMNRHLPVDAFAQAAMQILRELSKSLPKGRLIVVSPQPNRVTLAYRAPYDAALRDAAAAVDAPFFDAGKEAFPAKELDDMSTDGLHLNDLGHARLAVYLAARLSALGLSAPSPTAATTAPTRWRTAALAAAH